MNVFVREAGTRNITVATAIQFSSAADPTDQLQRMYRDYSSHSTT